MSTNSKLPGSASPPISPPDLGREWGDPTAIFAGLLALYAWTAPRTVAFEDDGGFIMAAEFLGIAHPPGYPLYVVLAKLSTFIPLGSVAYRVHLLSALLGAGTCAVIWWIVRSLTGDRRVALIAALAYGLSPVMWSQSIIAEVYTLNTLLFFSTFALALAMLHSGRATLLPVISFLFGLSLCNHYPLALLAAVSLIPIVWPLRAALIRMLPLALITGVIALLPYVWMVLRSLQLPDFSFYGPIRNWDELVYYVGRKGYAMLENDPRADFADKIAFVRFLSLEAIRQYTPVGGLIAAIGAIAQLRSSRLGWSLGLVMGFLGGGFAVVALVTMDFQFIQKMIFRVYPMVPYGVMAIWLGYGLVIVGAWINERIAVEQIRFVMPGIGFVLLAAIFSIGIGSNDRHAQTFARDYAKGMLESLDRDAILFIDTDADVFPLGYLHLVEGVRPDVSLYHYEGLILPTRRFHARDGSREARRISARKLIAGNPRPIYFALPRDLGYAYEDRGLLAKLLPRRRYTPELEPYVDRELLDLVLRLSEEEDLSDPWTAVQLEALQAKMVGVLARVVAGSPDDPETADLRLALDALSQRFSGAYERLLVDLEDPNHDPALLLASATRIEGLLDELVRDRVRASFHTSHGRLLVANQRDRDAARAFEVAWRLHRDDSNPAYLELLRVYARLGDREAYHALRGSFQPSQGSRALIQLDRQMEY
jgi:hypothetical protein